MNIEQKLAFRRVFKKLNPRDQQIVEGAIRAIIADPAIGEAKKGDLAGWRVYKFRMNGQLLLLAYTYDSLDNMLYLQAVGPHENFYRDLKKH